MRLFWLLVGFFLFLTSSSFASNHELCKAIRDGHISEAVRLVKATPREQIDEHTGEACTYRPLKLAIFFNRPRIVRALVQAGASLERVKGDNISPLEVALTLDDIQITIYLLKRGANPNLDHYKYSFLERVLQEHNNMTLTAYFIFAGAKPFRDYQDLFSSNTLGLLETEMKSELENLKDNPSFLDLATYNTAYFLRRMGRTQTPFYLKLVEDLQHWSEELLAEECAKGSGTQRRCEGCKRGPIFTEGEPNSGPANCGCFYCKECIHTWAEQAFRQHQIIQCPGCNKDVTPSFFQRNHFSREIQAAYKYLYWTARMKAKNPDFRFCPTQQCLGGKVIEEGEPATLTCNLCFKTHCLRCAKSHLGSDCEGFRLNEEYIRSMWEKGVYQQCPKCLTPVEIADIGCGSITCFCGGKWSVER